MGKKRIFRVPLQKFGGSCMIIVPKNELRNLDVKIMDMVNVSVELVEKAYKCNDCKDGICYIDILTTPNLTEDLIIKCSDCENEQKLEDSEEYFEWLKHKND